ncbi:hypothetical protein GMSM_38610 [Geomonas sp. Red276]
MADAPLFIVPYLYQSNVLLELVLLGVIVVALFRPRLLVSLTAAMVLIRPNERMELSIPLMEVLPPALLLLLIMHAGKVRELASRAEVRYLHLFVGLTLAETLILHPATTKDVLLFLAVGFLLYLAILLFMADDDGIRLLSRTVLACALLICLEPVYYHFALEPSELNWQIFHLPKSGRLQAWGMWANPNETAFVACLGAANASLLASKYPNPLHRLAALGTLPFFALVVFLTASRAGLASLLLIYLPVAILSRRSMVRFGAVAVVLLSLVTAHLFTPERTDEQASTDDRSDLRYRGEQVVKAFPLAGVGFLQARNEVGCKPLHNSYLQAFAETGLPGGFLLTAFLGGLLKRLYGAVRTFREEDRQHHLVYVLGFFVSSLFYLFWGNQLLTIMFFLLVAQTVIALRNAEAPEAVAAEEEGPWPAFDGDAVVVQPVERPEGEVPSR